jgi:hypothetical protein
MNINFINSILLLIINFANGLKPLEPSENYSRSLIADDTQTNQYQVFWKILDNEEIQFEIHVKSLGIIVEVTSMFLCYKF